ncbi:hypothetical protein [Streptomyces anulatus]|uniref:hypothetical protein n=1 Tax=Streptomyces anulatus TaxID=1892 RepID=UPI0033214FE4
MKLTDLRPLVARRRDGALSFDGFRTEPTLAALRWPDDVLEPFPFDHGDNTAFVKAYNTIDLHTITWQLETVPAAHFTGMPTGVSDEDCIESYAEIPVHWVTVRPPQIARHRDEHGTWLRPPLLIGRRLLDPDAARLRVLESRTRVGVLRGRRLREHLYVVPQHRARVGRQ